MGADTEEAMTRYLLALTLLAVTARAEAVEIFDCQTGFLWIDDYEIILVATIYDDGESGTIKASGKVNKTLYDVPGINREWFWELDDDGAYKYRFILAPDGSAAFLDYSGVKIGEPTEVQQHFVCKRRND